MLLSPDRRRGPTSARCALLQRCSHRERLDNFKNPVQRGCITLLFLYLVNREAYLFFDPFNDETILACGRGPCSRFLFHVSCGDAVVFGPAQVPTPGAESSQTPGRAGSARSGSVRPGSVRFGSSGPGRGRFGGSVRSGSAGRPGPWPVRAGPHRAGPGRAGPDRGGPHSSIFCFCPMVLYRRLGWPEIPSHKITYCGF